MGDERGAARGKAPGAFGRRTLEGHRFGRGLHAPVPRPQWSLRRRRQYPTQLRVQGTVGIRLAHIEQRAQPLKLHLGGAKTLVAPAAAFGQQRALGVDRHAGGRVVDGRQYGARAGIIGTAFDRQRALRRRRRAQRQRQQHAREPREQFTQYGRGADRLVLPEAREAGEGEDHAIELPLAAARLAQALEARIDVAAQLAQLHARCARKRTLQETRDKSLAPRRGTADAQRRGARQELGHVRGKKHDIARVFAHRHGAQVQVGGPLETEVLVGMHGEIDRTFTQRGIDLRGEEFLAVDLRERSFDDAIAAGVNADEFDHEPGVQPLQRARHGTALRPCQ